MSEQIILPGQMSQNFDTSSYTSQDFHEEIVSSNIRSTFFTEGDSVEFPCVCIDLSKTSIILKISMEALKKLLIPEEKLKDFEEDKEAVEVKPMDGEEGESVNNSSKSIILKSSYDTKIGVYINTSGNKKVRIGYMREHTARHVLPYFIKSTFPSETVLYISEDGVEVEEFKTSTISGVKLEFNY